MRSRGTEGTADGWRERRCTGRRMRSSRDGEEEEVEEERKRAFYQLAGAEAEGGGRRRHGDAAVVGVIGVGGRGRAVSGGRPDGPAAGRADAQ